jgi:hypothetical protein
MRTEHIRASVDPAETLHLADRDIEPREGWYTSWCGHLVRKSQCAYDVMTLTCADCLEVWRRGR